MTRKSKSFKARTRRAENDPSRPFDQAIVSKARKIVADYEIVMWFEDGEWYARGLELPNTYGDGKTPAACIASVRERMTLAVATMLEDGERPPTPAKSGQRTEQVNIRLTAAEKARLENRSRSRGFRGVSDYVRAAALSEKE